MQKVFYAVAQEHGPASAQWGALKILWDSDGLTASEMSERLFLKNSSFKVSIPSSVLFAMFILLEKY
jgi:hypothetical protein